MAPTALEIKSRQIQGISSSTRLKVSTTKKMKKGCKSGVLERCERLKVEIPLGGSPLLLSQEEGEINGNGENRVFQITRNSLKDGEGVTEDFEKVRLAKLSLGTTDCKCFELHMGKFHSFHISLRNDLKFREF